MLITSFIGGKGAEKHALLNEEEIKEKVFGELKEDLKISGSPEFQFCYKWTKALPQYNIKLKKAKTLVQDLEKKCIFISANWIGGVSLPDCIKKSQSLVNKISKIN